MITGPNPGSNFEPMINSLPPFTISTIKTPLISAFLSYFFAFLIIVLNAAFTSASLVRFTLTPPASDLWIICGEAIFITTGYPIFFAVFTASDSLLASALAGRGKPYALRTS